MSEIPEVFAIFEQKLAHVLSFNLRQKGQKKAIEELLVYFSGIVERASKAEARIAELEGENTELKERVAMLDVTAVFKSLGEMGHIEKVTNLKAELDRATARIAELKEFINQLIEIGEWGVTGFVISNSFSSGGMYELAKRRQDEWNALVKDWKEG